MRSLNVLRLVLLAAVAIGARAQSTAPVLMLSDIHFDPYHDPAQLADLNAAPIAKWDAILSQPVSATQATELARVTKACNNRGIDSSYPLLMSALQAAHRQLPHPLFITVSGDLMGHGFDCRYRVLRNRFGEGDYEHFAAKTVAFVAGEIARTFPHTPIYFALGNNDSGCTDYAETPNSPFLHDVADLFAETVPERERKELRVSFASFGNYSVQLPSPMGRTRLIVLQNVFESTRYQMCPGTNVDVNVAPGDLQIGWLRSQLAEARAAHQHAWVMAHIPTGVDPYQTLLHDPNVCAGKPPVMFLANDGLADALTDFADVVRLAIFAHTHMDEVRLLDKGSDPATAVPAKLVPSISPVNGNNPAFTVAQVETQTGTLKDYTVYAATNQAASGWNTPPTWSREYTFSAAYHLPDFSAASVAKLTAGFVADRSGSGESSSAYQHFYFAGETGLSASVKATAIQLVWPTYACSIANVSISDFRSCECPAKGVPKF